MGSAPVIALRTYSALRMGMVAVIVGLFVAIARQVVHTPNNCVQRSISAYYYTPVRPVFVGALVVLGLLMICLWGLTAIEDAFLNLAGMLAFVVAFVPTLDANYCSLPEAMRSAAPGPDQEGQLDAALIAANRPSVHNSFFTLLTVLGAILLVIAVVGVWSLVTRDDLPPRHVRVAYIATWAAALALVVASAAVYNFADHFFEHRLHAVSAIVMFVFIIGAVVAASERKRRDAGRATPLSVFYVVLAALMAAVAVGIALSAPHTPDDWWYTQHSTFLIEAILISLLAVFWVVQTVDRRGLGAPTY